MPATRDYADREALMKLDRAVVDHGADLALFLVFDRPVRADERPGLSRTFFAQRCVSDAQLEQMTSAFRGIGAYVELFEGEGPLLSALANGRLQSMKRGLKLIYNGIEGGIAWDGFQPGRKALIPAVADSYGLPCSNSSAYACALGRHKFHYFTVLKALGIRTPETWHYRPGAGWAGDRVPPAGTKVIAKSTYESWSVGVTEESIFVADESCESRVSAISEEIGQAVTVQRFVAGTEVGVTVLSCPEVIVPTPVETVLAKAPGDPDAVMTVYDNLRHAAIELRRYEGPPAVLDELRRAAAATFDVLELGAFARVDCRVDAREEVWVTDVGVSPGIGSDSAAYQALVSLGFDYESFLRIVIGATLGARGLLN